MRRSSPDVAAALSRAIREIAGMYELIPEPYRPNVTGDRWRELERKIDACCADGDEAGALRATARWRDFAENAMSHALLNAPLGAIR